MKEEEEVVSGLGIKAKFEHDVGEASNKVGGETVDGFFGDVLIKLVRQCHQVLQTNERKKKGVRRVGKTKERREETSCSDDRWRRSKKSW